MRIKININLAKINCHFKSYTSSGDNKSFYFLTHLHFASCLVKYKTSQSDSFGSSTFKRDLISRESLFPIELIPNCQRTGLIDSQQIYFPWSISHYYFESRNFSTFILHWFDECPMSLRGEYTPHNKIKPKI